MLNNIDKIAIQIKHLRQKMDVSIGDAAKKIGIAKSALSKLENAKNKNPGVGSLAKLAKYYGIYFVITAEHSRKK